MQSVTSAETLVVQTVGLTKVFKDFWWRAKVVAVRNLNLQIHPGEVFGLLGPNGSGKSTTIKILLGLLHPTKGRVAVFGRPPTDVAIKARIGYLPEESYLYRFLNARETLDFYGRLFRQGRAERRRRMEKLLEMVGLQHAARRPVGVYSKGMARLIGLAQALINDPDLLILDEPTAGLDPLGTRLVKNLIRDLSRRGKTVLLSSHLLADVEDVCDRLCILYGGEQRALGGTRELLSLQGLTQITSEQLSERTVREVGDLIRRLENKNVVKVSAPADRLEDFFLRIVRQAQADRLTTSGVAAQGRLPDFLAAGADGSGREVIDRLLRASDEPAAELSDDVETAAKRPADQPRTEVLQELVEAGFGDAQAPAAAEPAEPFAPQVDRELIDTLLEKPLPPGERSDA